MDINMKPRSCKNKGIRLQKWVAEQISNITGISWGKDKEIRSREAGQQGTDVVLSDRVKTLFPFSIECKNVENINLWDAIEQAKSNQQKDTEWLLFIKRNNVDPVVVMDCNEFFRILKYVIGTLYETDESVPTK